MLCGMLPSKCQSLDILWHILIAYRYYLDGKIVEVSGPELMGTAKPYHIYPGAPVLSKAG